MRRRRSEGVEQMAVRLATMEAQQAVLQAHIAQVDADKRVLQREVG